MAAINERSPCAGLSFYSPGKAVRRERYPVRLKNRHVWAEKKRLKLGDIYGPRAQIHGPIEAQAKHGESETPSTPRIHLSRTAAPPAAALPPAQSSLRVRPRRRRLSPGAGPVLSVHRTPHPLAPGAAVSRRAQASALPRLLSGADEGTPPVSLSASGRRC
jgi:hypothetical protein